MSRPQHQTATGESASLTRTPAKGWESLAQQARENAYRAWIAMRTAPRPATETPRHHRLKGGLAHGTHRGRTCEQWQIEVTGGGRIWYGRTTAVRKGGDQ
ncbi:hypothetical protein [Streptomyces sp. NPDC086787]|uniref:hypothetical protein n=1 Tax=Streptomyces sp. NPDC086787 TaxID=3365759 RepID=UPI00381FF6B1